MLGKSDIHVHSGVSREWVCILDHPARFDNLAYKLFQPLGEAASPAERRMLLEILQALASESGYATSGEIVSAILSHEIRQPRFPIGSRNEARRSLERLKSAANLSVSTTWDTDIGRYIRLGEPAEWHEVADADSVAGLTWSQAHEIRRLAAQLDHAFKQAQSFPPLLKALKPRLWKSVLGNLERIQGVLEDHASTSESMRRALLCLSKTLPSPSEQAFVFLGSHSSESSLPKRTGSY